MNRDRQAIADDVSLAPDNHIALELGRAANRLAGWMAGSLKPQINMQRKRRKINEKKKKICEKEK